MAEETVKVEEAVVVPAESPVEVPVVVKTPIENPRSTSPIPEVEEIVKDALKVDFYTALKGAVAGKKITKLEWDNVKIYVYFNTDTEHLTLRKDDGKDYDFILRSIDVTGDDWVVLV